MVLKEVSFRFLRYYFWAVSILVVLEMVLKVIYISIFNSSSCYVSILVVLEMVLKVLSLDTLILFFDGFNPCCSGNGAESIIPCKFQSYKEQFQSLLFWKWC